jgi:hypothetical protein
VVDELVVELVLMVVFDVVVVVVAVSQMVKVLSTPAVLHLGLGHSSKWIV